MSPSSPLLSRAARLVAAALASSLVLAACAKEPEPEPTAVALPVETPTPTPTPTPVVLGPPAPLTGVPVSEEDGARPALSVKIENTSKAQPQAGLEVADVVLEEVVEGGVTRFFAVFHSAVPDRVGPIRSARLVDADLLPAFDGILLYSGGRPDVESAIVGTALRLTEGDPGVFRESSRRAPSNLFATGAEVYAEAMSRDDSLNAPQTGFVFSDVPPAGESDCSADACDATAIDVSMSASRTAGWTYDAAAGLYRRSQNGTAQPTESGVPIGAANVIVAAIETFQGGCCDTAGSPYIESKTTGSGRAIVLRDGRWYEAEWVRPTADKPWKFTIDGVDVQLKPGPTWIHLTPSSRLPAAP